MARKRIRDNDDAPRSAPWMNTYADMVTLLMTFFILLFSMSLLQEDKFRDAMGSFHGAFGILDGSSASGILDGQSVLNTEELVLAASELARLEVMGGEFKKELAESGMEDKVSVEMDGRGLVLRFADSILFDLGSVDVRAEGFDVLIKVGELLRTTANPVRVEGHTDNWPIQTHKFPSNWELSTGRATSVVRFFIDHCGFAGDRLQAAGYGEYHPLESNDTAEGRQRNRRVDIVILRESLAGAEPD